MHPRYSLFNDDPDDGGGGGLLVETPPVTKEPAGKSDVDKQLDELKETNARLLKENADAKADAKFWADRGKQAPAAAAVEEKEEPEEPEVVVEKLSPEEIIDGLTKDPRGTMKKLGLLTVEEMRSALREAREETRQVISETRSDAEFGMAIEKEFPEFRDVNDPLTQRAGEIYRAAVALDPHLGGTRSLAVMAGRQARAELKSEGKGGESTTIEDGTETRRKTPQQERREKIERQVPSRERNNNALEDDEPELSAASLSMAKAFGNDPKEVAKAARGLRNNGR